MDHPFSRAARNRAIVALIAMRTVYAFNWFDIGAGLPSILREYGVSTADAGWLVAVFFLGAGAMQLPAGLLARRWGTKPVTFLGAAVLGAAALASSVAPDFSLLVALRFTVGLGAGLFFSPAIALVTELFPPGERGLPVGTFTSSFSLGAGLGVFLPALLLSEIGWRGALALGGMLMLGVLVAGVSQIPSAAGLAAPAERRPPKGVPAPLRSLPIWAIGFAFIGLEGASLSSGQYFILYATSIRGATYVVAGILGALFVFPSLFGGPVGGWLTERFTNRRTQMFLFTALPGLLFLAIPFAGFTAIGLIAVTFSFCYGMVYPIMYVLPPYLPGLTLEDLSLSIGLLNMIQLAGGGMVALAMAEVIQGYGSTSTGYTVAWVLMGLITATTLVFLLLVPRTGPHYSSALRDGPSGGPGTSSD